MGELIWKSFEEPDEVVEGPCLHGRVVVLGETYIGRYVAEPGWRWSIHVKPMVGTQSCQHHHQGIVLSGQLRFLTDDGGQRTYGPNEVFDVGPGHDGWVVGDEPCVTIEFHGVRGWAKPANLGERVLATILFTDIVGSTDLASRLGDAAWKDLLERHTSRVRQQLDHFRGFESATTGDGFLALFDGAARAVRCASAIREAAKQDGIEVRIGIHCGEVERHLSGVQGLSVHLAARVMSLAGPGEILLSESTVALLEGSEFTLAEAGQHELKGFTGRRWVYRLAGDASTQRLGV